MQSAILTISMYCNSSISFCKFLLQWSFTLFTCNEKLLIQCRNEVIDTSSMIIFLSLHSYWPSANACITLSVQNDVRIKAQYYFYSYESFKNSIFNAHYTVFSSMLFVELILTRALFQSTHKRIGHQLGTLTSAGISQNSLVQMRPKSKITVMSNFGSMATE